MAFEKLSGMSLWKLALTQVLREIHAGVDDQNILVFRRLTPDDVVKIEIPGKKPRTVKVTSRPEKLSKTTWWVGLASGYVRPGHRRGGSLILREAYITDQGKEIEAELTFQATLQQQTQFVQRLTLVRGEAAEIPEGITLHGSRR